MSGYSRKDKLRMRIWNRIEEQEHFHQDVEVVYVLEGTMELKVGENKTDMKPEDILVINANQRHSFQASSDILFVTLSIEYGLLSDIFGSSDLIFWCDSTKDSGERYEKLRKVIKQLINNYMNTNGSIYNFEHIALCYQIMDVLAVNFLIQSSDRGPVKEEDKFEARLASINNYIRANYDQPISMRDLAEKMYLSNGYLSRFFKKNYGMSFAEYLSNVRLHYAVEELLYTDAPITKIAYDNGFASVAVFNKVFRERYRDTPSSFRKNAKNPGTDSEKDNNNEIIKKRLEKFLLSEEHTDDREEKSGIIHIDQSVTKPQPFQPYWNGMINGGTAEDLLRSEVKEHLFLLKEALGFQYVRFWNIFSRALLIDITARETELNFTRLDSILDYLLQIGMKPHIELGQKPKRIHGSVQDVVYMEENTQAFQSLEQWDSVLGSMMHHLIHRYGYQEIDSWRIEIWMNERKEMNPESWEEYFEWFNHSCTTIRRYSKMKIGGCGIRIDYAEDITLAFLQEWKKQEYQPDYLSITSFSYERGEINSDYYAKRSLDNELLLHKIQSVRKMMQGAGMGDLDIYVTEWNMSISDRNYINDSCFKGAYIVKNVLDVYGQVKELGYFHASDHVAEYFDTNALLQGSMGLMTKDNILKPAAFAFDFLNRLYPYCVGHGDNYLISTDEHQTYGIICHNQKKLNYNYYFINEDQIEKEHLWKYFDDRDRLELKFLLQNVENGTYQARIYRINEKNGSILDIWAELDYEKELSREDIKYFRRVCEPKMSMQTYEAKNGKLKLQVSLSANEFAFVKIRLLQDKLK